MAKNTAEVTAGPLGRGTEFDLAVRVCRRAAGEPRTLLVLGEEGIGKTHLFSAVKERLLADGVRVLSAHGWIVERDRPFAVLRRLFAPVAAEIQALPEPHARVLRAVVVPVVAASTPDAPDTPITPTVLDVEAAVSALADRLSATGRSAIIVDDLQHCDRESLHVLCALSQHPADTMPAMLLAARGGELPASAALPGASVVQLAPLALGVAARLLDAQPGAPRGRRRLEILAEAQGNPLAILELCPCRGSADAASPASRFLPWHAQPEDRAFEARLSLLPPETQHALLYAALALPGEDVAVVMAALGSDDLGVWAPAESAGLVTIGDGAVVFRHPLARSTAASRQPLHLRHRAHRELASAAQAAGDLASRARHRAAATLGTDEAVAQDLRQTAWHSVGDTFTAARILEQSAQLTAGPADRTSRLAEALVVAGAVGDLGWVRDLHEEFDRFNRDPAVACVAACAASAVLSLASYQREAFDLLTEAAAQYPEMAGALALTVAALAAGIAEQSGLPEHRGRALELLERAEAANHPDSLHPVADAAGTDVAKTWAVLQTLTAAVAGPDSAALLLRRLEHSHSATRSEGAVRLARSLAAASAAYRADDPDTCLDQYRRADAQLQSACAFGIRAWLLAPLADMLLATGRWAEAESLLTTARDQAAVLGLSRVENDLSALAATLRSLRGDSAATAALPGPGTLLVNLDENAATRSWSARARARAAMVDGDWSAAFRLLRSLFGPDGEPVHPHISVRCIADLAVAAVRTGETAEAAQALERVRARQGDRPSARMSLLLHHAAALVDPHGDPEDFFKLALVNAAGERWPLERAQARLSYAIWLRRGRRPSEAREQLAAALELAQQLGAMPLAEAIRAELRASGVATAPEPASALADLTAQQQQIVRLAASGLSNREIGEQLYLSPRTVGSHLYNVYPKLGISSRHQLRGLLQDR